MWLVYADDSRQRRPSRTGMGALVAAGGVLVPEGEAMSLRGALGLRCAEAGFGDRDPFKWSPGRELWMHHHLVGEERRKFFAGVLADAAAHGIEAIVVVEDTTYAVAAGRETHEQDAVVLLLERVNRSLRRLEARGVVFADRPGGGRHEEEAFLASCLETLVAGTAFMTFDCVAAIATSISRLDRLAQLADLVTAATTSAVAGYMREDTAVLGEMLPLFRRGHARVGGSAVKIHPDMRYVNLYHWLFGDPEYLRVGRLGFTLPSPRHPYARSSEAP